MSLSVIISGSSSLAISLMLSFLEVYPSVLDCISLISTVLLLGFVLDRLPGFLFFPFSAPLVSFDSSSFVCFSSTFLGCSALLVEISVETPELLENPPPWTGGRMDSLDLWYTSPGTNTGASLGFEGFVFDLALDPVLEPAQYPGFVYNLD